MEFRTLRSFLAVAREQSISGAARSLNITQPSLSRQIMELEEEMGVKLLERGNRKVTLTRQGMLLCKRAGQIMDLVQKTREEVTAAEEECRACCTSARGKRRPFVRWRRSCGI